MTLCSGTGNPAELIRSSVESDSGRFVMHSEVLVALPPAQVLGILTQFENLPSVNGGIRGVNILHRDASGQVRMQVFTGVCILMFCKEYQWVQEVNILPGGEVMAVIDPVVSDFREGWARWRFLPQGTCTRLVFEADLRPDFWFPPVVGQWLLGHKLAAEALETGQGVERLARAKYDPVSGIACA